MIHNKHGVVPPRRCDACAARERLIWEVWELARRIKLVRRSRPLRFIDEFADQTKDGCVVCSEANDGGYETSEGVGPFCSQCWQALQDEFQKVADSGRE